MTTTSSGRWRRRLQWLTRRTRGRRSWWLIWTRCTWWWVRNDGVLTQISSRTIVLNRSSIETAQTVTLAGKHWASLCTWCRLSQMTARVRTRILGSRHLLLITRWPMKIRPTVFLSSLATIITITGAMKRLSNKFIRISICRDRARIHRSGKIL